jgi:hypothetical protein
MNIPGSAFVAELGVDSGGLHSGFKPVYCKYKLWVGHTIGEIFAIAGEDTFVRI